MWSVVPAVTVVAAAAFLLDRQVWWLDGRWLLLLLGGLVGVVAALLLPSLGRQAGVVSHPEPALPADQGELSLRPRPTVHQRPSAGGRAAAGLRVETLQLPKMGAAVGECEDAFACDSAAGICAVADGASSSFDAAPWAQLLADRFVDDPDTALTIHRVATWLDHTREQWQSRLTGLTPAGEANWWEERPREDGAFSTLLGVQVIRQGQALRWEAAAVGDSCLVQVRAGEIVGSFPADVDSTFGRYPPLLASVDASARTGIRDELARFRWGAGQIAPGDVLLLMTDAVADWLLTGSSDHARILGGAPWPEVLRIVTAAREKGEIANDDITLLRLHTS